MSEKIVFPPGKLPLEFLQPLLQDFARPDARLVTGPRIGEDVAVIDMGDRYMVVKTDPITFATDEIGWYAVHVNANDLAVTGAVPTFMTVVALLPPVPGKTVDHISRQLAKYADALNITIIGGHTEITTSVNTPILTATMFGPLKSKKIISAAGAKVGEVLIMTQSAAIEATAIIAREKPDQLHQAGVSRAKIRKGKNFLFDPGISILTEADLAVKAGCSAMHDVTEGGIITAAWELAKASGVRIELDTDAITVLDLTRQVCAPWGIDPLRAISSGA